VFLSYSSSHLGYRCFDIASQRIYISCHVCFHEHVLSFYNSEQIAKASPTPPTQTATTVLLNLLHSPMFPAHTALPRQRTHPPQHPPFLCPSSHTCLSNHSIADIAYKSISPTFQRDPSAGVGPTSGSSSAPPHLASVQAATDSASTGSPVSATSPLLAADLPQPL